MLDPTTLQAGYEKLALFVENDNNLHNLNTNYQTVQFSDSAVKILQENGITNIEADTEYQLSDLLKNDTKLNERISSMLDDETLITKGFVSVNDPELYCTFDSDYVGIKFSCVTLEDTIQLSGSYTFKESYINRLRGDAVRTDPYKEKMANVSEADRAKVSELEISSYVQDCLEECVGNIKRSMEDNFLESDHPSQSDLDKNEITFCIILDRSAMEKSWEQVKLPEYEPGRVFFTRAGKFMACLCNISYLSKVILPEDQQKYEMSAMDSTLNALYDQDPSASSGEEEKSDSSISDAQNPVASAESKENNMAATESDRISKNPPKEEKKEEKSMPIPQNQQEPHAPQDLTSYTYRNSSVQRTLEALNRSQAEVDKLEGRGANQPPYPADNKNASGAGGSLPPKKKKKNNKKNRRARNGEQRYEQNQKVSSVQKQKNQVASEAEEKMVQTPPVPNKHVSVDEKNLESTEIKEVVEDELAEFDGFDSDAELPPESEEGKKSEGTEDEDEDLMPEIPPQMFEEHPDLQTLKDQLYAQVARLEERNKKALDARKASLDRFGQSLKARSDDLAQKQKEFQQGISAQEVEIQKKKNAAEDEAKKILDTAQKQAQEIKDKTAALVKDSKLDLNFQRQALKEEQDLLAHDRQALDEERQLFESEKAVQQSAPEFVYTRVSTLEEEVKRLNGLDEENKKLSTSHEESLQKIQELQTQLGNMVPKEMAAIDVDGYRRMESAVAKLKGKRIELENLISTYKKHIGNQKDAIDALTEGLSSSEQQMNALSGQVDQLKATLTQKTSEIVALKNDSERVTREFEQYRCQHTESTSVAEEQQERIQSLSQTLTEKQAEIDALDNQLNTLQSENQSLRGKISSMESDNLSKHMETVNTQNQEVAYSANTIISEMRKIGVEMSVVPAAGRSLLQGKKDGTKITFNFENEFAIIEKPSKRPATYLSSIAEWNDDGGATFIYYIKNRSVECKIDYHVRKDSNYLREHELSEIITDVLEQFQTIKK